MKRIELDLPLSNGFMVRTNGHLIDICGLSVVLHKRSVESKYHNADSWTASEFHTGMELLTGVALLRSDTSSRAKVHNLIKKKITNKNVKKYLDAVKNNKSKWVNK